MKWNPFSKRINGIGPGPGDMAQARMRAMGTIARQAEQDLARKELEEAKADRDRAFGRIQRDQIPDTLPEAKSRSALPRLDDRQTSGNASGEGRDCESE